MQFGDGLRERRLGGRGIARSSHRTYPEQPVSGSSRHGHEEVGESDRLPDPLRGRISQPPANAGPQGAGIQGFAGAHLRQTSFETLQGLQIALRIGAPGLHEQRGGIPGLFLQGLQPVRVTPRCGDLNGQQDLAQVEFGRNQAKRLLGLAPGEPGSALGLRDQGAPRSAQGGVLRCLGDSSCPRRKAARQQGLNPAETPGTLPG